MFRLECLCWSCSLDYKWRRIFQRSLLLVEPHTIPFESFFSSLVTKSSTVWAPFSSTSMVNKQTHDALAQSLERSQTHHESYFGEWQTLGIQSPLTFLFSMFPTKLSPSSGVPPGKSNLPRYGPRVLRIQRMRPSRIQTTIHAKMVHFFHCLPPRK